MSLAFVATPLRASHQQPPPAPSADARDTRTTPSSPPTTVRKRVRFAATNHPSTANAAATASSVDAAIRAGALSLLPSLVARDVKTITYSTVLRATTALIKAANWRSVISVYDIVSPVPSLQSSFTTKIYTDFFFALMKVGTRIEAVRAFEMWRALASKGPDACLIGPRAFNFIYVLLSRHGMVDQALQVQKSCVANGYYLNRYSFNAFLHACAKSQRITEAFETLKHMAESNVSPDVVSFNVLIACCVRAGDLDIALKILERMRDWGIKPDIYSYNSVVNGLRKNRMLDEAFELVRQMEEESNGSTVDEDGNTLDSGESGVSPDLVTYNTLISGIAGQDVPDFPRAISLKEHMHRRGIMCNEVSYNALMAAAARSDHIAEAFDIYEEMTSRRLKPNCECFTTLITLCGRAKMIKRAFQLHEHMIASGIKPSVVTYNALLTACRCTVDGDAGEAALKVLNEMEQMAGCTPDVITYSTVIDALGRSGKFEQVRDILKLMSERGIEPNLVTYTSVISALTRCGDFTAAMQVLEDMQAHGVQPNVYTFSSLINGAGRCGEYEKAFEILDMMRSRGIQPSKVTYSTLFQIALRSKSRRFLEEVVDELERDSRLYDMKQVDKIVELASARDIFDVAKNRSLVVEINAAIQECFENKAQYERRRAA